MKNLYNLLLVFALLAPSSALAERARFQNDIVASFVDDGRNMRLEQSFGYVDPAGKQWNVPAGSVTDGASVPRVLWVAYPPFTGLYRKAAVLHDHYCQQKTETWKATHAMFYDAMRTAGVDEKTAKVMWAAVYHFGPRWGGVYRSGAKGPGSTAGMTVEQQDRLLRDLERWIEVQQPSLDEIARRLDTSVAN